ncbi:hypothetical protein [Streptomyces sp. NPDC093260]|uniref:hypothetical protein n=1 Tax=Streptomyces sp. NPDC093260 TaxID=3155073 RepID=UPI00343AE868
MTFERRDTNLERAVPGAEQAHRNKPVRHFRAGSLAVAARTISRRVSADCTSSRRMSLTANSGRAATVMFRFPSGSSASSTGWGSLDMAGPT